MTTIELALMSRITGGADSTSRSEAKVKAFGAEASYSQETRTSDNESCRRDVRAACNGANPSAWNVIGLEGRAASQCFVDNFPKCPP